MCKHIIQFIIFVLSFYFHVVDRMWFMVIWNRLCIKYRLNSVLIAINIGEIFLFRVIAHLGKTQSGRRPPNYNVIMRIKEQ